VKKTAYVFLALFLVAMIGAPVLYAEEDSSGASGQAQEVASVPSTFDGGEGATLNEDAGQNSGSRMPHVKEVMSQDDVGGSDPSAFEGDSDSKAGEKAPENLPMNDAPVDAGMSIH
jgi:hypothetical protein